MHVKTITQEQEQVVERVKPLPSVSIVLPFEPKMTPKSQWEPILKGALKKAEKEQIGRAHV